MYKIFHKYDDVDINMLFSDTPVNITRNSDGKLFLKHARTNIRKFSFSHRVVNHWNSLPSSVKFSKTLNEFKNRIDALPQLQTMFIDFDE